MFQNVLSRLATEAGRVQRCVKYAPLLRPVASAPVSVRSFTDVKDEAQQPFDTSLLQFLVCPLSKKPLKYEVKTNELINEELGIAYPIIDGIPNMIPQDARLIQKDTETPAEPTQG
ncbi:protein preY, mitochondrial [Centroberyx affinis]|uniref:protein preY, mitochondrial n=1 Tax=Centroberyx affinis TaxID=166261 RepID=UPI003A5BF05A